jgi:hypothetical protein
MQDSSNLSTLEEVFGLCKSLWFFVELFFTYAFNPPDYVDIFWIILKVNIIEFVILYVIIKLHLPLFVIACRINTDWYDLLNKFKSQYLISRFYFLILTPIHDFDHPIWRCDDKLSYLSLVIGQVGSYKDGSVAEVDEIWSGVIKRSGAGFPPIAKTNNTNY